MKHEVILLGNAEEPKKKKVISFHYSVIYSKKILCKNYFANTLEVSNIYKIS